MITQQLNNVFSLFNDHVLGEHLGQKAFHSFDAAPGANVEKLTKDSPISSIISNNENNLCSLLPENVRYKTVIEKGDCPLVRISFARDTSHNPIVILKLYHNIQQHKQIFVYDACTKRYEVDQFSELGKDISTQNLLPEVRSSLSRISSTINMLIAKKKQSGNRSDTALAKITRYELVTELRKQQKIKIEKVLEEV